MSDSSESSKSARALLTARPSPMATIESSVTRLLVSTKHLLESLTQWARQEADDKFVLDAYVKLGNDFRTAARSFSNAGVDITDLGDVPRALRIVLESALSEAPTQANLDKFLPNIRSIIVTLLSNLKTKQLRAKERAGDHRESPTHRPNQPNQRHFMEKNQTERLPLSKNASESLLGMPNDEKERPSDRLRPSKLLTKLLVKANVDVSGHLEPEPVHKQPTTMQPRENPQVLASNDALARLQQGNVILRRASKRFSAYQFAKLTNFTNSQVTRLSPDLGGAKQDPRASRPAKNPTIDEIPDLPETPKEAFEGESAGAHIFLRLDDKTRKVAVQLPVTMASLRLLFVEKFAYSPKTLSFPEIYLLNPKSSVSYELEEHLVSAEVKSGSLLMLKVPSLEKESLKHLESSVKGLNIRMDNLALEVVTQVREALESNLITSNITSPESVESSKELFRDLSKELEARNAVLSKVLKGLQQELKSVKQILDKRGAHVKELMQAILGEICTLKDACLEENSPAKNRSFMQESYAKLSKDSDSLLTRVDDLQDVMEELRKDVAQRGVRLGTKQLKTTQKEIQEVKQQLSGLVGYIMDGKPSWKKIWEAELDKVCEEQQFFNLQDDLTRDLDEDIRKIEETFELIEKCRVHKSKQILKKSIFTPRIVLPEPGESVHGLRDAVLNEVSTLKPDHESRLDAIAKAEKLRERERQLQSLNQFQEELGDFVGEKKLKNHGGIEELEKKRKQQDAENLKSLFGIV